MIWICITAAAFLFFLLVFILGLVIDISTTSSLVANCVCWLTVLSLGQWGVAFVFQQLHLPLWSFIAFEVLSSIVVIARMQFMKQMLLAKSHRSTRSNATEAIDDYLGRMTIANALTFIGFVAVGIILVFSY